LRHVDPGIAHARDLRRVLGFDLGCVEPSGHDAPPPRARAEAACRPRRRATDLLRFEHRFLVVQAQVHADAETRVLARSAHAWSNAAPTAIKLVLVTIPRSCALKMARSTPSDIPRSSAFTIK